MASIVRSPRWDTILSCTKKISTIELVQFWNVFVLPFMSCTWYYITIPFKQTQSVCVWVCGLLMPGTYGVLSKAHSLWDSYVEGFLMMLKPGWRYSPQSKFTGYKMDFQCRYLMACNLEFLFVQVWVLFIMSNKRDKEPMSKTAWSPKWWANIKFAPWQEWKDKDPTD